LSCPHCHGSKTDEELGRFKERQRQITLAKLRDEPHMRVAAHTKD
jgi:UPF0176 protein